MIKEDARTQPWASTCACKNKEGEGERVGVKVKVRGTRENTEKKEKEEEPRGPPNPTPLPLVILLSYYLFSLEQCQGEHRAMSRGAQTICSPPLARSQKSSSFPNEFYFRLLELGKEVKHHYTFLSYIIAFKILKNSYCVILALSHVHV